MDEPLVSVVMATYNGARYLPIQIESIIKQTYKHLEIIIIDDVSTDETADVLKKNAADDSRIKLYFSERNQGAVATFEKALQFVRGEFVVFSDQDDWFREDKIELQVKCMQENPDTDLVLSDLALVNQQGALIAKSMWEHQRLCVRSGKPFKQLLYANFATGCAIMIRKRLLDIALPFPDGCIMHDWWLSVLSSSSDGGGITVIHQPLTFYRQHSSNVIGAHSGGCVASIKRAPILSKRCIWYQKNTRRLEGYLLRRTWRKEDLLAINEMIGLFSVMSKDQTNSFVVRIASLWQRLSYGRFYGWVHAIGILIFALFPKMVDWITKGKAE